MQTSGQAGVKLNSVPTATELIRAKFPKHDGIFVLRNIEEFMIEFAAMHVKAALEEAFDNVPYGYTVDSVSYEDVVGILTCYPLTNIK
jgi:hypothetical protein